MPEADGVTAATRIRALAPPPAARRPPRIVAVTADTLAPLRQRCAEAGIEAFVPKPFRVDDMRRVVARFGLLPDGDGRGDGDGGDEGSGSAGGPAAAGAPASAAAPVALAVVPPPPVPPAARVAG